MKLLITGASGPLHSKLSQLATEKDHTIYPAYHQHKPRHGAPVQLNIAKNKPLVDYLNTSSSYADQKKQLLERFQFPFINDL